MHLFGHHHDAPGPHGSPATPPPQPPATTVGWQPVDGRPFLPAIHDLVHDTTRAMYGRPRSQTQYLGIGETIYRDAFRGIFDSRTVIVANALTPMDAGFFEDYRGTPVAAVAAVEVPTLLFPLLVQSRRFPDIVTYGGESPTGDALFDQRFRVTGAGESLPLLTDVVRQCVATRDDWAFWFTDYFVVSISRGSYTTSDEMNRRVGDMLTLVAALPESVVPRQVDHSADDLAARIDRVESIEDAIAFLQALTPAERETLARSHTPLAAFADVRTPEEAMARLMSLDVPSRMQLFAVFTRVRDR